MTRGWLGESDIVIIQPLRHHYQTIIDTLYCDKKLWDSYYCDNYIMISIKWRHIAVKLDDYCSGRNAAKLTLKLTVVNKVQIEFVKYSRSLKGGSHCHTKNQEIKHQTFIDWYNNMISKYQGKLILIILSYIQLYTIKTSVGGGSVKYQSVSSVYPGLPHLERKYRHLKYAVRCRDKILINWLFA